MENCCIFTICARNYLAQALTLKETTKRYFNGEFKIFIIDGLEGINNLKDKEITPLSIEIMPEWIKYAMKYDVTEFSTSVKPFCFYKLFKEGYKKVVYLDPDMYVQNSLDYIFKSLDNYSIILTPHFCNLQIDMNIAGYEKDLLIDGVYNLGFVAIKNDKVGNNIVEWWKVRLHEHCFIDRTNSIFTDQKWMIYIPMFYPKETLVTHHLGINVAVWNFHERSLMNENGKYYVIDKISGEKYPLIIFHFSGFLPKQRNVFTWRKPEYNVSDYPEFYGIINEYANLIESNSYNIYSHLKYKYNQFDNGVAIFSLHRRIFNEYIKEIDFSDDPFSSKSSFYLLLKKKKLLIHKKTNEFPKSNYDDNDKKTAFKLERIIIKPFLKLFLTFFGIVKYSMIIRYAEILKDKKYHYFLVK